MITQGVARPVPGGDGSADLPNTLEELRTLLTEVRERVRRHRDTVDMRLECAIVRRMSEVAGSHVDLYRELQGSRPGFGNGTAVAGSGRIGLKANGGRVRVLSM